MASNRQVDRLVIKWRNRLWLNQWRISTEVVPVVDEEEEEGSAYKTTASVEYEPIYQSACITVGSELWAKQTPKSRNRTICHEMVHIKMSPVDRFVSTIINELPPSKRGPYLSWRHDLRETLAEEFTNVLLDAAGELK